MYDINAIFYRIDVSEGIDVNKTSASKTMRNCRYWCFINYSFRFQLNVCNRCYDLLMMSMNLGDIAVLSVKGSDYRCIISFIRRNKVIKLMQNAYLTKKSGTL